MHSLYVVGLNFYLQSAKRKWSLTSCTKCYSAHHSARGESVEDEVCQELLVYIPERPQNIQLSRPITAIEGPLSVLNSLCNTGNNTHCLWGRGCGEVLWLVWGPIPVPTGKLLSTAIAFYIHREIRGRRDELVTNLQGYLKVGNVNPQAVNF